MLMRFTIEGGSSKQRFHRLHARIFGYSTPPYLAMKGATGIAGFIVAGYLLGWGVMALRATLSLNARVSGSSPIGYQWLKDGRPIVNATNAVFALRNVQPVDAGTYLLAANSPVGTSLSQSALLRIELPQDQPAQLGLALNHSAELTIEGAVGRRYQIEYQDHLQPESQWTSAEVINLSDSPQTWIDRLSTNSPHRFYRAVLLP